MHKLRGAVQHYDWGDLRFLPDLLGVASDGRPWAEIWFGTHPMGHARVITDGGEVPLAEVTGELPLIVKVLSAAAPLSLQTHPTREQAREGFARENDEAIALDDPRRTYRDQMDKPEILIALTPFEALCGFAPLQQSKELLEQIGMAHEAHVLETEGIGGSIGAAMTMRSMPRIEPDRCPPWLARLAETYTSDPGLRVAPLLHHVVLAPGEAVALPAGNLHQYLAGAGLEVMTASDNVVRAAFTSKHRDVREMLRIVDTEVLDDPVVRPTLRDGAWHYPCPTTAFAVERIDLDGEHLVGADPRPRILVVTEGDAGPLACGEAAVLTANESVTLSGVATVWSCVGTA